MSIECFVQIVEQGTFHILTPKWVLGISKGCSSLSK